MEASSKALNEIRQKVIFAYPSFATEISKVNLVFHSNLPYHTAATDGKYIYFDPEFFQNLTDSQRIFLMAHEILHVKFQHMFRIKDENGNNRNFEVWNIATDAIINANLERDGFEMPEGGVKIPGALNYTAEELYDKLIQEAEEHRNQQNEQDGQQGNGRGNGQQADGNGDGQSQDGGEEDDTEKQDGEYLRKKYGGEFSDDHTIWQEVLEDQESQDNQSQNNQSKGNDGGKDGGDKQNSQGKGNKSSIFDKFFGRHGKGGTSSDNSERKLDISRSGDQNSNDKGQENNSDNSNNKSNNSNKNADKFDEKKSFEENREYRKSLQEDAMSDIDQEQSEVLGESNERKSNNLGRAYKSLSWKDIIRQKTEKSDLVWSRRRSIRENNYRYRLIEEDKDDDSITECMIDISGSVNEQMVRGFLRQLKPLLTESKLRVGFFASYATTNFIEIKTEQDIERLSISANVGYGTNMDAAVKAFSKDPEGKINKIVFTDGEAGTMPSSETKDVTNLTWLVYGPAHEYYKPCCGETVRITDEEMRSINGNPSSSYSFKEIVR